MSESYWLTNSATETFSKTNQPCSSLIRPSDSWPRRPEQVWVKPDAWTRRKSRILLCCLIRAKVCMRHRNVSNAGMCYTITSFKLQHRFPRMLKPARIAKSQSQWLEKKTQKKQGFAWEGKNKLHVVRSNRNHELHQKLVSVKLGLIRSKQPDKPSMIQYGPLKSSQYRNIWDPPHPPFNISRFTNTNTSRPDNMVEMNHLPLAENNRRAKGSQWNTTERANTVWRSELTGPPARSNHASTLWVATVSLRDIPASQQETLTSMQQK